MLWRYYVVIRQAWNFMSYLSYTGSVELIVTKRTNELNIG